MRSIKTLPVIQISLTCISYYFKISQSTKKAADGPGPSGVPGDLTAVKDPLPNLFHGMVFLFDDSVSEEDRKSWSRYIVAYDGDVVSTGSNEVTHVIYSKEEVSCHVVLQR